MSSAKKLLVVFGATGQQGGSIINAVLTDVHLNSTLNVRGVTRDPTKPAATALASRGVEIVKADLNDVGSLRAAVVGADTVFGVTNPFDTGSFEGEVQQGVNVVAAVKSTTANLIWSSFALADIILPDPSKFDAIFHWKSKVFVEKAAIEQLGRERCVFLCCGTYMEDLINLYMPKKGSRDENKFKMPLPVDTKLSLIGVERDVGTFTKPVLKDWNSFAGTHIYAAAESLTINEIATTYSKVTGKHIIATEVSNDTWFETAPEAYQPLRPVFAGMIWFIKEYGLFGTRGDEGMRSSLSKLPDKPHSFSMFLEERETKTLR